MPTVLIVYYSRTGNTELIAQAIEQGAKAVPGVNVILTYHAIPNDLQNADAIIIGTPTYNHKIPAPIQNLLETTIKSKISLKGKLAATFGSYGWSGEASREVFSILRDKLHTQAIEPPLLSLYEPDQNTLQQAHQLGKKIAQTIADSTQT